jgi:hypothetical protein
LPLPLGGLRKSSNISSSSSHNSFDDDVCGSIDVDVNDAPGKPVEYGDIFHGTGAFVFEAAAADGLECVFFAS